MCIVKTRADTLKEAEGGIYVYPADSTGSPARYGQFQFCVLRPQYL